MTTLFGGGSQTKEAQRSREMQQISNERILAQQQADSARAGVTRRAPKGRRLFVNDTTGKSDLS